MTIHIHTVIIYRVRRIVPQQFTQAINVREGVCFFFLTSTTKSRWFGDLKFPRLVDDNRVKVYLHNIKTTLFRFGIFHNST